MASSLSNPFLFQITIIIAASIYSPLPGLTVPTDNIIWLSFEAVLHSLGSQLISWPSRIVQRYMLETSTLNFRIVSYFHSSYSIYFITIPYFFITSIASIVVVSVNTGLLPTFNLPITVSLVLFAVINLVITLTAIMY